MNERPHLGEAPIRGSTPRSGDDFRADIQGLRGVAVLIVALGHAGVPGMSGGYVGVDVFFVISGFLITGWLLARALDSGRVPFGDFYASRARRILPAAVLTLVVTCAASVAFLNPVRAASALHDAVWAASFSANIHFAQVGTDYFAQDDPPSPFQHFWTLAVEEQFYLAWPLLLAAVLLILRVRGRGRGVSRGATRRGRRARRRSVSRVVDPRHGNESHERLFLHPCAGVGTGGRCAHRDRHAVGRARAGRPACRAHLGRCRRHPRRDRGVRAWHAVPRLRGVAARRRSRTHRRRRRGACSAAPAPASSWAASRFGSSATFHMRSTSGTGRRSSSPLSTPATRSRRSRISCSSRSPSPSATSRSGRSRTRCVMPGGCGRPRLALALWPISLSAVVLAAALGTVSVATPSAAAPSLDAYSVVARAGQRSQAKPKTVREALLESVSSARLRQPVPRALAPPLGQLLNDRYRLGACVAGTGATSSKVCELGDTKARRRLVVLGDSHAAMWMPALIPFARRYHWRLVPLIKPGVYRRRWVRQLRSLVPLGASAGAASPSARRRVVPGVVGLGTRRVSTPSRGNCRISPTLTPRLTVVEDPPSTGRATLDCLLARGATLGSCAFRVTADHAATYSCDAKRGTGGACDLRSDAAVVLRAGSLPSRRRDDRDVPGLDPHHGNLCPTTCTTVRRNSGDLQRPDVRPRPGLDGRA